jgi:hypothetical protein
VSAAVIAHQAHFDGRNSLSFDAGFAIFWLPDVLIGCCYFARIVSAMPKFWADEPFWFIFNRVFGML